MGAVEGPLRWPRSPKASRLKLIPVPIPPREEQTAIVSRVSELMAWCDRLVAVLNRGRDDGDALVAAVVHGEVSRGR